MEGFLFFFCLENMTLNFELELHKKSVPGLKEVWGINAHYYDSSFVVRFNSQKEVSFSLFIPRNPALLWKCS